MGWGVRPRVRKYRVSTEGMYWVQLGVSEIRGVPYYGVLIRRILLFRVLY